MQPTDHNDSQSTRPTQRQVKRAISNAVTLINEDTAEEGQHNTVLGETARPQERGQVAQRTRPSPEFQREHAETAFCASAKHLINTLTQSSQISPVTVALDVAVVDSDCWIGPETYERTDTSSEADAHSGKLHVATATIVNSPAPVTLDIIPLNTGENDQKRHYSEIAQELLYQATQYADVEAVLTSRAFNSAECITEFEKRDLQYIVPARKSARATAEINRLSDSGITSATVEPDVAVCGRGHRNASTAFVYIPDESGSDTVEFTPFLSNIDAVINDPACLPDRFNQRSQAAHHARLFRKQLADKSAPASELSVRAFWVAATEVNAYQLARMVLAGASDDPEAGMGISFAQFIAFVRYERQFGSLSTQE